MSARSRMPVVQDLCIKSCTSVVRETTGGNRRLDKRARMVSIPMLRGMERPFSMRNEWKSWNTQPSILFLPQTIPVQLRSSFLLYAHAAFGGNHIHDLIHSHSQRDTSMNLRLILS